jgi:hypothetical protein
MSGYSTNFRSELEINGEKKVWISVCRDSNKIAIMNLGKWARKIAFLRL